MKSSSYSIVNVSEDFVLIKDDNLGGKSIKNDAENVTLNLYKIYGNKRFYYIDSIGEEAELIHNCGNFIDFRYFR